MSLEQRVDGLRQDGRLSLRLIRRSPIFFGAAILTLALGIGANGAVFSILRSALLQPLPYDDESRLAMLWHAPPVSTALGHDRRGALTAPMVMSLRHATPSQLGEVAAGIVGRVGGQVGAPSGNNLESELDLVVGDQSIRLSGATVTPNFFRVLGVNAAIGRVFGDQDEQMAETPIILSDATWRRDFGADPNIVGRLITATSGMPRVPASFTVVGVLPRSVHFSYPDEVQAWLVMPWTAVERHHPGAIQFTAVARLRPGLSTEQARALVAAAWQDGSPAGTPSNARMRVELTPMREWIVGDTRPSLYLLGGVAALLLLVTCVTVSNGLLARISERQTELAVRSALGAARSRVLQQLLVEGTLLSIGGTVAGTLLAILLQPILRALLPDSLPQIGELRVDTSIVAFGAVMTAVTTILAAVAPAWGGTRQDAAANLARTANSTANRSSVMWRHSLVGAQAALTTTLLIVSALLLTSLWRLGRVAVGFDAQNVVAVDLQLLDSKYFSSYAISGLQEDLLRGVRGIHGIMSAGVTSAIPFRGFDSPGDVGRPGSEKKTLARIRYVDEGFFSVFHVPLVRGRLLNSQDRQSAVAVVSESYARIAFGTEDPLGHTIQLDRPTEVVGVVGDLRYVGLDKDASPAVYVARSRVRPLFTLVVRLDPSIESAGAIAGIRSVLRDIDPQLPPLNVAMVEQLVDATVAGRRFYSVAAGAFALVALVLTTVGLTVVVARAVAERRRELAVRAVLGATWAALARASVGQALIAIVAGVGSGLVFAGIGSVLLAQFLFQVAPRSPGIYAAAALLVIGVAGIAAWLPMRRLEHGSLAQLLRPD